MARGTSEPKRTVSRYLTRNAPKESLGNLLAQEETTSPQRFRRSRSRRQVTAPDVAAASPWQVPWESSPQPSRARKYARQIGSCMGLFTVLPKEVSGSTYLGFPVEHPCTEGAAVHMSRAQRAYKSSLDTPLGYIVTSHDDMGQSHCFHMAEELLGHILNRCTLEQLGMLRATCRTFANCELTEHTARARCQAITRAQGLQPTFRKKETWMDLLRCLSSQPQAAAQATALSLGAYHTVALMAQNHGDPSDLQLYAFGRGFHGQLGNATYGDCDTPTKCSGKDGRNFLSSKNGRAAVVSAGSNHNLLITRRGEIFAWGLSSSGELGQRDTPIDQAWPIQVPNVGPAFRMRMLSVSAGGSHSLAICETGELWACGRGRHGQLGFGNFEDATTLRPIASLRGVRIVAAAAGEKHSLALATHGAVYAWGCGRCGQLGVPEIAAFQAANPGVQPAMHTPQFVRELDPTVLQPWDRITSIAAGLNHNAAMSVAGEIYMWGSNKHGCLGLGDTNNRVLPTKVNLLQQNAPLKRTLQAACGKHRWKEPRAVQVTLGAMHSFVLIYTPTRLMTAAAGYNGFGQLGTGEGIDCKRFTAVAGLSSVATACIVSGENHACAVAKNGDIYLWGRGDSGQLGAGNDFSQRVPQKLAGYHVAHPDHTLRSPYSRAPSA